MTAPAMARQDLRDRGDVEALVREFYRRAFAYRLLGPVLIDIARMDLPAHLPIICDFWETVLFRAGTYRRNAFTVHVNLHRRAGLTSAHFARWLALWTQTVDDLYAGAAADRAKVQAARIADSIHRRLHNTRDIQPLSIGTTRPRAPLVTAFRTGEGASPGGSHQPPEAGNTDLIAERAVIEERHGLDEHL
jgi:hemoglobin